MKLVSEDNPAGLDKDEMDVFFEAAEEVETAGKIALDVFGEDTPALRLGIIDRVLCFEERKKQLVAIEDLKRARICATASWKTPKVGMLEVFFFFDKLFGDDTVQARLDCIEGKLEE